MDALFFFWEGNMGRRVAFYVFFIFCLVAFATGEDENNWNQRDYEDLVQPLLKSKKASPDKALELARYMMKRFPGKDAPYGVAVSLYTLKKDFAKAEETLKTAIQNVRPNDDFLIKLAHFYKRTDPVKLTSHIETFKKSFKSVHYRS